MDGWKMNFLLGPGLLNSGYMGVSKNSGIPKMDGENKGTQTLLKWMILRGNTT